MVAVLTSLPGNGWLSEKPSVELTSQTDDEGHPFTTPNRRSSAGSLRGALLHQNDPVIIKRRPGVGRHLRGGAQILERSNDID